MMIDTDDLVERCHALEDEVARLSDELASANAALDLLGRSSGSQGGASDNVYVFDDERADDSRDAFDEFFAAPDPHLDKVRGFLLD